MSANRRSGASRAWGAWWRQTEQNREAGEVLFQARLWAPACFYLLQAIETALKALAREPDAPFVNGEPVSFDDTGPDETGVGGKQPRTHDLTRLLGGLHVQHRAALQRFHDAFEQLDRSGWYESARYPEWEDRQQRWHPEEKWYAGFSEEDAVGVRALADEVLAVVEERLPHQRED